VKTKDGQAITEINELEYCPDDDLIYANIWYSDYVHAFDPKTGLIQKTYDLSSLYRTETRY
jgi:glutamine cyclotransferase